MSNNTKTPWTVIKSLKEELIYLEKNPKRNSYRIEKLKQLLKIN
jgi:hypothetical protein